MTERVKLIVYSISDGVETVEQFFIVPESMAIGDHGAEGDAGTVCECFTRPVAETIVALWNSHVTQH